MAARVTCRRRGHLPVPAYRAGVVHVMLDLLALQPGLDECRVRLEILLIAIQARGVEPRHQCLIERRSTTAERVDHGEFPVQHVAGESGGQQGHVEQQLGELLVGLSLVLLDGDQVVIEAVQGAELDGPEQVARHLEQRVGAGEVGQECGVPAGQATLADGEHDIPYAANQLGGYVRDAAVEDGTAEHLKLGLRERDRRARVDAVSRRQDQQRIPGHEAPTGPCPAACGRRRPTPGRRSRECPAALGLCRCPRRASPCCPLQEYRASRGRPRCTAGRGLLLMGHGTG